MRKVGQRLEQDLDHDRQVVVGRVELVQLQQIAAAPPNPNPPVGAAAGAPPKEKLEPVAAVVVVVAAGVDPKLNPVEPPAAGAAPAPNEKFMTSSFQIIYLFLKFS